MSEKYILVLSSDMDVSTDNVLSWLYYYNTDKVIRINTSDKIELLNIYINNGKTQFYIKVNNDVSIHSDEIKSYWYRRGELSYSRIKYNKDMIGAVDIGNNINAYYYKEYEHTTDTLYYLLKETDIVSINSFNDISTNKLINLDIAKQSGLLIPDTIVSNDMSVINQFFLTHKKCITKPIRYPGYFMRGKNFEFHYSQQTNLITQIEYSKIAEQYSSFQPTLFQEYIEKEFEIRVFLLIDKLYSMAIFSQQNEKTKVDFRNYDDERPNRNVPFKLPKTLEKQIIEFSKRSKINCGSIDLLYKSGKYYFLEINPVGQFQWHSHNCYYNIEDEIAKYLIGYGE